MEFTIKTQKVTAVVDEQKRMEAIIKKIGEEVSGISNYLSFEIREKSNINGKLKSIVGNVNEHRDGMHNMASGLQSIVNEYEKTEQKVVLNAGGTKVESEGGVFKKEELFWKTIGKAGVVGSGISLYHTIADSDGSAKDVISVLKNSNSFVGKVASIASKGSKTKWQDLIDWVPDKSFVEKLGDYNFKNATKLSDKVKTGAKWAGHILTLAGNAVENYVEFDSGEITAGRAVQETVGETVVDIALGAALTFALGATIGAVGAPAVVVAGIGVFATWALDGAWKALTGKDFAENVSDFIIDGSEKIVEGTREVLSEAGKAVGECAKKAGDVLSAGWSSVCKTFSFSW